ncbi:MAG: flagellar filament capping protein FliD [Solirubrobacterales bacterium]
MGNIQLSGLATGIDTETIVKQLMEIEKQRLYKLQTKESDYTEKKSALKELKGLLEKLDDSVDDLSNDKDLRSFTTTTSDEEILTASASESAGEGSHTIVINQLACSNRWVHTAGMEYSEDLVGAGTFIFSYNNEECVISTTEQTTLDDLVGLINNSASNPGVTASLLYNDGAYHLVLSGDDAGSDYEISVNSSNTEVWSMASEWTVNDEDVTLSDKIQDLDQFSGTTFSGDETITISGATHDGTAVSVNVSINKNTTINTLIEEINDAFGDTATATLENGQIILTDKTCGASQMTFSLSYNAGSGSTSLTIPTISQSTVGGSVSADLTSFAQSTFTETQAALDAQIKVDGYPSAEGEWLTRSTNSIDDVIKGVTLNLQNTGTVRVNLTRDTESVKSKINTMVNAYNEVIQFIQDNTGYEQGTEDKNGDGAADGVAGILMTDTTVRNMESNLRSPLIRRASGFLMTVDSFLTTASIGLEVDEEGTLSFTESDFDDAIAEDYLGVLALIGADKTGSSDSNTIGFYGASSKYTDAGSYNVRVTVAGGVITSAQIKLTGETTWRDATIDGSLVTGNNTFLEGVAINPENGLQLSVDTSKDGTFNATVQVRQGFAGAMAEQLNNMLKSSNGTLTMDIESLEDSIGNIQEDIDNEEDRLDRRQTALEAKYAALERTLTLLQSQTSMISAISS